MMKKIIFCLLVTFLVISLAISQDEISEMHDKKNDIQTKDSDLSLIRNDKEKKNKKDKKKSKKDKNSSEEDEKLQDYIEVEILSSPGETAIGKPFSAEFSVKYFNKTDDCAYSSEEIKVIAPSMKTRGELEETLLKTNEEGIVSFSLDVPQYAQKNHIVFDLQDFPGEKTISIPFTVATDLHRKGGSIAIVDLTKAGRVPQNSSMISSSLVLKYLMRSGFKNIGNSDLGREVFSGDDVRVQNAAIGLFGRTTTYLIYGTIRYCDQPKNDNENWETQLAAKIKIRNLLKNSEIFAFELFETGNGKTESASLNDAREKLCKKIAEEVIYQE